MPRDIATVLVTAIGGGGHGEQILKALRLVEGRRYRMIGGDANPYCPQFADVDAAVCLPRADAPDFVDAVLAVARHFGASAVFHGCEPELNVYSRERGRFEREGILLPINPPEVIELCFDKKRTNDFLAANGFDPPRSIELMGVDSVDEVGWFPVVVKPRRASGGSKDCYIAQDRDQLALLIRYLAHNGQSTGFVVQEYCGTPEAEFTVGVLHDLDGNFLNSIAVRRELRSQLNVRTAVPNRSGYANLGDMLVISSGVSHGYVGRFPEVCGPCEHIAAALGVKGAVNIQCRFVEGRVKVFEINPRFSGTTSIRAMMGYNEPDALLRRHLFGDEVRPRFSYRTGMVLRSLREQTVPDQPVNSWHEVLC
jgi:carbamoyl-phosphate synthase large subunit